MTGATPPSKTDSAADLTTMHAEAPASDKSSTDTKLDAPSSDSTTKDTSAAPLLPPPLPPRAVPVPLLALGPRGAGTSTVLNGLVGQRAFPTGVSAPTPAHRTRTVRGMVYADVPGLSRFDPDVDRYKLVLDAALAELDGPVRVILVVELVDDATLITQKFDSVTRAMVKRPEPKLVAKSTVRAVRAMVDDLAARFQGVENGLGFVLNRATGLAHDLLEFEDDRVQLVEGLTGRTFPADHICVVAHDPPPSSSSSSNLLLSPSNDLPALVARLPPLSPVTESWLPAPSTLAIGGLVAPVTAAVARSVAVGMQRCAAAYLATRLVTGTAARVAAGAAAGVAGVATVGSLCLGAYGAYETACVVAELVREAREERDPVSSGILEVPGSQM
ncbi:hypothetical protein AMAG_12939 [Allomyces macrogynus ATCC 38327]|uniref:Uncharacterized protein n=1 Tax=Allomyces macrogynus (strain ATCC 38327) TaxID=578462 RepID=A0A0L0T0F5_ALLM3|nr:hypothetical protein AMAG_12939 [Allomyces macrogynus ATCC 38327]|eukprot:KNE68268.1 hypothetical protein AMAG_12939 [Allomyces macrogynus ATCC 38327]